VTDPQLRQRVIDECLVPYLHDGRDAWDLRPDGTYLRVDTHGRRRGHSAQAALVALHGSGAGR
jgi:polyphosphate kinase